jgi:transcriptional regulator NrdR family protein
MRRCPECGADTSVLETRDESTTHTRRRRICKNAACGHRFTTAEFILDHPRRYRQSDLVIVRRAELQQISQLAARLLHRPPAAVTPDPEPPRQEGQEGTHG